MISSGKLLPSWVSGSAYIFDHRCGSCSSIFLQFNSTKNHDMDKEVEDMYELSMKTLELPLEEKIKSEGYEALSHAWY